MLKICSFPSAFIDVFNGSLKSTIQRGRLCHSSLSVIYLCLIFSLWHWLIYCFPVQIVFVAECYISIGYLNTNIFRFCQNLAQPLHVSILGQQPNNLTEKIDQVYINTKCIAERESGGGGALGPIWLIDNYWIDCHVNITDHCQTKHSKYEQQSLSEHVLITTGQNKPSCKFCLVLVPLLQGSSLEWFNHKDSSL